MASAERRIAADRAAMLPVAAIFAVIVLKEPIGRRYLYACADMGGAAAFMFPGT